MCSHLRKSAARDRKPVTPSSHGSIPTLGVETPPRHYESPNELPH